MITLNLIENKLRIKVKIYFYLHLQFIDIINTTWIKERRILQNAVSQRGIVLVFPEGLLDSFTNCLRSQIQFFLLKKSVRVDLD